MHVMKAALSWRVAEERVPNILGRRIFQSCECKESECNHEFGHCRCLCCSFLSCAQWSVNVNHEIILAMLIFPMSFTQWNNSILRHSVFIDAAEWAHHHVGHASVQKSCIQLHTVQNGLCVCVCERGFEHKHAESKMTNMQMPRNFQG